MLAGLVRRRWPNLGQLPGWNRAKWPNPVFGTTVTAELGSPVPYPDDDPGGKPQVDYVPLADVRGLPKDGLAGPGWIEGVLDLRLHGGRRRRSGRVRRVRGRLRRIRVGRAAPG